MKSNERFIVFDVNETLLDIEVLNPFFHRNFGDERIMRQWFSELIIYSQSLTLSGRYTPFGQLAIAGVSLEIGNYCTLSLFFEQIALSQ